MRMNEYQQVTEETAIYPDELPDFVDVGLVYVVLGQGGEGGEIQEKLKKAIREDDPEYLEAMKDEVGDTLWYLARVCEELDTSLEEVAEGNLDKLLDRRERGQLTGEGDDR